MYKSWTWKITPLILASGTQTNEHHTQTEINDALVHYASIEIMVDSDIGYLCRSTKSGAMLYEI
jgi:hypothetical protein